LNGVRRVINTIMSDFNKILTAVKGVTDEQLTKIYVPSAKEELVFRPLTAKQQKDLVKTAAEKNTGIVSFYECINNIIYTNSVRSHEFLVYDRDYVITMLRANTMSAKYTAKNTDYDLTKIDKNVVELSSDITSRTLTTPEFIIKCRIPTLKTDSAYNNHIIKAAKKDTVETFGDLFIYEAAKYIEAIESPTLGFNINLSELSVLQRYQLVESLPARQYNEIIDYINIVKTSEDSLFTINGESVDIQIDQSFFTL